MASLSDYLTETRALLNDPSAQFYSTPNLTRWINLGRKKVAQDAQCVRAIPRSSAALASIAVTAGGSGYTSATVTISAPNAYGVGFTQATATATVLAGVVTAINITNAGTGYINPGVTVTIEGDGTGATASATLQSYMTTVAGQEVYNFSTAAAILRDQDSGLRDVLGIQSIAVSWGASKPTLGILPWSAFQAYVRSLNIVSQNYPRVWAQYAQGVNGSIYLYPVPATAAQMEWDCYCTPVDLVDDTTIDLIPYPWTEVVPYYAKYCAYQQAQRQDDAQQALADYKRLVIEGRVGTTPAMVPTFYGATAY